MKKFLRLITFIIAFALIPVAMVSAQVAGNDWLNQGGNLYTNTGNGLANADIHVAHCYIGTGTSTSCGGGGGGSGWSLTGNSGTTFGTNFVGTTDNNDLAFKVDNTLSGFINSDQFSDSGNTGLGYNVGGNGLGTFDTLYGANASVTSNQNNSTAIGYDALSGYNGVSLGYSAGIGATGNSQSVYLGAYAGQNDTEVSSSDFTGYQSGTGALAAFDSVFDGQGSGVEARTANNSEFIGSGAGGSATNANNAIFLGYNAGSGDTVVNAINTITYTGLSGTFTVGNTLTDTTTGATAKILTDDGVGTMTISTIVGAINNGDSISDPTPASATISTISQTFGGTSILIGDNTSTGGFSDSIGLGADAVNTAANQFVLGSGTSAANYIGNVKLGDWGDLVNGTQVTINDAGEAIDVESKGTVSVGEFEGRGNNTNETFNDPSQTIADNTNIFNVGQGSFRDIAANITGGLPDVTIGDVDDSDFGITFEVKDATNSYIFNHGNFNINTVHYSWPASQAGAPGDILSNDGAGTLSWIPLSAIAFPIQIENTTSLFSTGMTGLWNSNSTNSLLLGSGAGDNDNGGTTDGVTWLGTNAGASDGACAMNASRSDFIGYDAGFDACGASNSTFLGYLAGGYAKNADYSFFAGAQSGEQATYAGNSFFFGQGSGANATNATNSNFIGLLSGSGAQNALGSTFIGYESGYLDENANDSIFLGNYAGSFSPDQTVLNNAATISYTGESAPFTSGQEITDGSITGFVIVDTPTGGGAGSMTVGSASGTFSPTDTITQTNGGQTATVSTFIAGGSSILIGENTSTDGYSNSIALGANATNSAANQFLISSSILNTVIPNETTMTTVANVPQYLPSSDPNVQTTCTNATCTVVSDGSSQMILNPSGAVAGGITIQFPASPVNGQLFTVTSAATISNILYTGGNVTFGTTTLGNGLAAHFVYNSADSYWFTEN